MSETKKQKEQKFELSTLSVNNVVELDGWVEKQKTAVKENPFIEITNRETYEIAKSRRTALVSARTAIQNQDKTIGSVLSKFRKQIIAMSKDLVAITEPHEEKQQKEVSRWEAILEEKRREKELEEERRVNAIKDKIDQIRIRLNNPIDFMTIENISGTKEIIENEIEKVGDFDFEEFQPMFDDVVKVAWDFFNERKMMVEKAEEDRMIQVKKDQESKVNELYVQATEIIDSAGMKDVKTLKDQVKKVFETDFDFGDFGSKKEEVEKIMFDRVEVKLTFINNEIERQQELISQQEKERIVDVREGLLDLVYQLNIDSDPKEYTAIENGLNQENPFPDFQDEFDKMISVVKNNFELKKEVIKTQRIVKEQNDRLIREAIDKRTKERVIQIEKIGFVFNNQTTENFWNHVSFDVEIWESMIEGLTDDDWNVYFAGVQQEIKETQAKNKEFAKRKKAIEPDKKRMIEALKKSVLSDPGKFKNEECLALWNEIEQSFSLFVNTKIETINKF